MMQFSFFQLHSINDTLGIIAIALVFIANYIGHIAKSVGYIAKSVGKIADKDE